MLHRAFQSYGHYRGPLDKVRKGVLIAMAGENECCCQFLAVHLALAAYTP